MKQLLFIFFNVSSLFSTGQKFSVFENVNFDSSYTVIALSSSFYDMNSDSKEFAFLVNNIHDLNRIKKEWTVKTIRPQLSIEDKSISIYILKDKQLVSSNLLIYPKQGIIKSRANWFDFDMAKFNKIQVSHPLNYHSKTFKFDVYFNYMLFKDSIQTTPSYLFHFEPKRNEFEGHFNIIVPIDYEKDSPIIILSDINKELGNQMPSQNFKAQYIMNDKFNLENKKKVKFKVECSKAFYETINNTFNEKDEWIPSTFNTKVFFKN